MINNYLPVYSNNRVPDIASIKLDHALSSQLKLSGYWSLNAAPNLPITALFLTRLMPAAVDVKSETTRVNVDYTLTPTMLLHMGVGFVD